ncbi:hypothetical protein GCM10025868_07320 [Angustibacter aerolatus]|uniref:DEAD/H associated domain-containing protein n=1 Tax=Angustibacter aerolatus TaxID=1162965 RepID=A0ABQ6JBC6_9ACTN|nr:hypothetical protein GCM10025868_07320 [Angustibacter aerolatus]
MVYESRVGDVFTLGSSSWRIEDITHDRVLVTPAPGVPGKRRSGTATPSGARPSLGRAVGAFVREVVGLSESDARARVSEAGLDEWATDNLLSYLGEQREATGHVPDDRTLIVERFRDEPGRLARRAALPFGAQVHAPWSLAIAARMRERFGVDVQAMHGDDGLVIRLPDVEPRGGAAPEVADLVLLEPDDVAEPGHQRDRRLGAVRLPVPRVRRSGAAASPPTSGAALAAVAAASARRTGCSRSPAATRRSRSCSRPCASACRTCSTSRGSSSLMRDLQARRVRLVEVETQRPSPFARSLLFGYVAQFLYEGDSPLAERRAAALALDPTLLSEPAGRRGRGPARACSTRRRSSAPSRSLQHLAETRRTRDAEDVADLLRVLGPLSTAEVAERSQHPESAAEWLTGLEQARRVIAVRIAGEDRWAVVEDAGRLQDALGTPLPVGLPEAFLEPVPDPLGEPGRPLRPHARSVHHRPGWPPASDWARPSRRPPSAAWWAPAGWSRASLRPGGTGLEVCDAEVLRTLRRRSLAALRQQVEPVPAADLARFVPAWQGWAPPPPTAAAGAGRTACCGPSTRLAGALVPASALETLVLPSRVAGWSPGLLDQATATGEVLWSGHGSLPGDDGWVSLHLADTAHLTLPEEGELELGPLHQAVLDALGGGGAYFFRPLADTVGAPDDATLTEVLWDLVWAGRITGDTLAPLRARLAGGRTAHKTTRSGPRSSRYSGRRPGRPRLGSMTGPLATASVGGRAGVRGGPPTTAGRWSALPEREPQVTVRSAAIAEQPARTARGRHPRRRRRRRGAGRVRRRLPGAVGVRGRRPRAARLLRRGPGGSAVLHTRSRRPAAGHRRRRGGGARRGRSRSGQPLRRGAALAGTVATHPRQRSRSRRAGARERRPTGSAQAGPQGRRARRAARRRAWCSTSSGVAARCCRTPTTPSDSAPQPTPSRSPSARGRWGGSPSSGPTGPGCSGPTTRSSRRSARPASTPPPRPAAARLTCRC